jgi:hypothetical protein
MANRERDRELLIPVADSGDKNNNNTKKLKTIANIEESSLNNSPIILWTDELKGNAECKSYNSSKS